MWRKSENGDMTRPPEIDTTSSKVYVYVRKDFEIVETSGDIGAHWRWDECKIPKEDWEVYAKTIELERTVGSSYSADRRYEPGEYLTVDGTMYKVLLPIMPGAFLTPGTNIEETDIQTEITKMNKEVLQ